MAKSPVLTSQGTFFFPLKGQGKIKRQSMKLHKTRCPLGANPTPAGRVFRLLRISRKGWACPAGMPYTGARSRGREVLANCIPTGFTWGQNTAQSTYGQTITRTSPFAKTKSIWHQAFGPHSKRSRILEFNNPTPQLKWQGFLPRSGRQTANLWS